MRVGLKTAVFAVLIGVAIAYFSVPARAEDDCRTWVTEMQEDEGGAVLTTHACSQDNDQAWMAMTCSDGRIWLRYDMALGTGKDVDYEAVAEVEFVTDNGTETLPMAFQAMDAMFAGDVPADGALIALLKSNEGVLVRSVAADYPVRTYSLKGSSKAISALVAQCR
jgi:hypothetical protein